LRSLTKDELIERCHLLERVANDFYGMARKTAVNAPAFSKSIFNTRISQLLAIGVPMLNNANDDWFVD